MASKQTRRSISIRGELYWRLKDYCDSTNQTLSGVVTQLIEGKLGSGRVDMIKAVHQKKADDGGGIFTF